MGPLPIVEPQVRLQIPLQLPQAGVVGAPEGHPPQLAEDRTLQPLDETVRPGMVGFGPSVLDAQLDAGRGDAVWCTAPPESPHAVWSALVGPWSRGAEVVLHQGDFDPLERLDLLYRLGPTILCQSPAEYRALAELRELERFRSPRLRRLVSTGDYLEADPSCVYEPAAAAAGLSAAV